MKRSSKSIFFRSLSAVLAAAAVAVTLIPVSDVEAKAPTSDFQMEGTKLLKYTGTAEVVSIPDSIKEIGEEAFAGNGYIVKVEIDHEVKKIGYRAFASCPALRTVYVGNSVETIEEAAFSNDEALVNVSLGTGVKTIGSGIFAGSRQLKTLAVDLNNPYLKFDAGILYDEEEKKLYELMPAYEKYSLTVPGTVEEISAYAFWGNPYLENVVLDSRLLHVPAYAFSNCVNLKKVEIPLPVRSIEAKAFEDCINLQTVILPDSMNRIHDTAFDGCHRVAFAATPGTFAGDFAAGWETESADRIEQEDVTASEIIPAEEIQTNPDEGTTEGSKEGSDNRLPANPTTIGGTSAGRILGQTSIVAGRAVIFIDNSQMNLKNPEASPLNLNTETVRDIFDSGTEKGKDFPKFTVAGQKIASQAFYQEQELETYTIDPSIKEIGEFAFARSGLREIQIPEGVTKIGYGAFYHCDRLEKVEIPDSVTAIDANAFNKTPWIEEKKKNAATPFLTVGDGILIAYTGTEGVVNIPAGVKQIAAETFMGHMGIKAVNLPDSIEVIGDSAFKGCRNLTAVNGGGNLVKIGDAAFKDCRLSAIHIPASVREIGYAAFDCPEGTDTVIFEGDTLPRIVQGTVAGRLSNEDSRNMVFPTARTAVVPETVTDLKGTVLDNKEYGFRGIVKNPYGNTYLDSTEAEDPAAAPGIHIQADSSQLPGYKENLQAEMPGNEGSYLLLIRDSKEEAARIINAYGELYGGRSPAGLQCFDISLWDQSGSIPITKLGKQPVKITLPKPGGLTGEEFRLVTLDEDGQLEAVPCQSLSLADGEYLQFTVHHFSPYAFYHTAASYYGEGVVQAGNTMIRLGTKDDTPDTGDPIHPKWFLVIGLAAAAVAFFFLGKRESKNTL